MEYKFLLLVNKLLNTTYFIIGPLMNIFRLSQKISLLVFIAFFASISSTQSQSLIQSSPNGKVQVEFSISSDGVPAYKVLYNNKAIIDSSTIGFEFKDLPPLNRNLSVMDVKKSSFSEKWKMVWGEQDSVENNYNELAISFMEREELGREFDMVFKVYDDGVGFRFEFPEQKNMNEVIITAENTEFQLTGDHKTWWIPGDWEIYEHLYNTTLVSEIDAISERGKKLAQTYIPYNAVNTPVTMKTNEGLYLSFHEANLTNYSGMTLKVDNENLTLTSELVDSESGFKVKTKTPFVTPWRTIQIAERAGDLIESKLIVNLNEPNTLTDVSWIEPMKYVGIWWEMHIRKTIWDYASGKHGATTGNTKSYIDFASKHNIKGVLVEGWNTGWEAGEIFDFVTPYPDYNLDEVTSYAKSKGIDIIMHHETNANVANYEQHMDSAYALMNRFGIRSVKTGYVGKINPQGKYHHGQWMVNHYRRVVEATANHQIMLDVHEPIKPTGIRRTYPNMLTREAIRGQEWNAWSSSNPPEHLTIVPFTRMLAGPIDYTPGIFDIKFNKYKPNNQVSTTLVQQLALFVVLYSPLQMAADLPENYEGNPAFQFIQDVPVDWKKTKVLDGEIGDFIVIAREDKASNNWFLGAVTDENSRDINIDLSFLHKDKKYKAIIYKDAADAHWDDNPTAYKIEEKEVSSSDILKVWMAEGGGVAISFFEL